MDLIKNEANIKDGLKCNGTKMLTLKGTYADIKDELPFEEGQKVNGKGVEFKITIRKGS